MCKLTCAWGIGLSCVSPFAFNHKKLCESGRIPSVEYARSRHFFGFYTLLLFSAKSFVRRLFLRNDFWALFPCFCKGLLLCHSLFFYNFFYFYRFFQVFIFIFTAFYSLFLILLKYFLFYFLINFIDFSVIFYIFCFFFWIFCVFFFFHGRNNFFHCFYILLAVLFFRHFYILHAVLFFRFTLGCSQSVARTIH